MDTTEAPLRRFSASAERVAKQLSTTGFVDPSAVRPISDNVDEGSCPSYFVEVDIANIQHRALCKFTERYMPQSEIPEEEWAHNSIRGLLADFIVAQVSTEKGWPVPPAAFTKAKNHLTNQEEWAVLSFFPFDDPKSFREAGVGFDDLDPSINPQSKAIFTLTWLLNLWTANYDSVNSVGNNLISSPDGRKPDLINAPRAVIDFNRSCGFGGKEHESAAREWANPAIDPRFFLSAHNSLRKSIDADLAVSVAEALTNIEPTLQRIRTLVPEGLASDELLDSVFNGLVYRGARMLEQLQRSGLPEDLQKKAAAVQTAGDQPLPLVRPTTVSAPAHSG